MEFLHFTLLTRELFYKLVMLCRPHLLLNAFSLSVAGPPKICHLNSPLCKPRDVVAMALKYLVSTVEHKELHVPLEIVVTPTFLQFS